MPNKHPVVATAPRRRSLKSKTASPRRMFFEPLEARRVMAITDIPAANLQVVQNTTANSTAAVTVTAPLAANGFAVRSGSNRGDYFVQIGPSLADDISGGVLISNVRELNRAHPLSVPPEAAEFATAAVARDGVTGGYFIPVAESPGGTEWNINVAAGYFPYSVGWTAGFADGDDGPIDTFTASPGINFGTQFVDNADGTYKLTIPGKDSRTDGVLIAVSGVNEDNFVLTAPNNTDGSFTIYQHDNGTNGTSYERDGLAFVFIPKNSQLTDNMFFGRFTGNGTVEADVSSNGFSITKLAAAGTYELSIPGFSFDKGVLLLTGAGGGAGNVDNIVSYGASGDKWIIETRDLNDSTTPPALQNINATELVASFVFIPITGSGDVSIDGSGNLLVNDVDGANSNDNLTFVVSGTDLIISDPNNSLDAGAGATQLTPFSVSVPLSAITGSIQITTQAGNDLVTLDLTGGDFIPAAGLSFDGGDPTTGTGDQLAIVGEDQGDVVYNHTTASSGNIVLQNFGTITYSGLEPISNSGTAANVTFNLPGTADVGITLSDLGGGQAQLQSATSTFESTSFAVPTAGGALTINLGANNQTLTINSLVLNANTDLIIAGDGGDDTINLNAAALSITDALTLTAETIGQTQPVTVAGLTTLNAGTGTVTLTNATNNFSSISIPAAGTVSLRDDSTGFVLTGASTTTSLMLNSDDTVTQTGPITGAGGLTKLGAGLLSLTQANDYQGSTTITGGAIEVGNGGTTGTLGSGPVVVNVAAPNGLWLNLSNTFTVSNEISGSGSVTMKGAGGIAILTNANSYNTTVISAGTLRIGNNGTTGSLGTGAVSILGTLEFNRTDNVVVTNVLSGAGDILVTSGVIRQSSNSSGFTGTATINDGGTLRSENISGTHNFNAASIVANNGGTYVFGNNGVGNPNLPESTYITANTGGQILWEESEVFGGLNLRGGSLELRSGYIDIAGSIPSVFESGTITLNGGTVIQGDAVINKTTAGTVTITGVPLNNTGGLNIQEGVLSTNAAIITTSAGSLGTATTAGTLRLTSTGALTYAKPFSINAGGGVIDVPSAAASHTLSGVLSGAGPLTKVGAGTITLSAASSMFTGLTTINEGRLNVDGTLGGNVLVKGGVLGGGVQPGNGIIIGSVTLAGGTLAPGASPGILQTGDLRFDRLTKQWTSAGTGAEIPTYDAVTNRVFVVNPNAGIAVFDGTTGAPIGVIPITGGAPNSVAVRNGLVAVAVEDTVKQKNGTIRFFNAATLALLHTAPAGALPDMLTFSPDGTRVLSANEGEPDSYLVGNNDPLGSVTIFSVPGFAPLTVANVASGSSITVDFTAFDGQKAALQAAGVRIFGPDPSTPDPTDSTSVSRDFEPEYIAVSPDGTQAFVTLQENNAFAVLNLTTNTFTNIVSLGLKNHSLPGNGFDASDRDLAPGFSAGTINIRNWPVFGMYQPDAISAYSVAGQTYYVTANEGDARDYGGFVEEIRVGNGGYGLDTAVFPNASTLKLNQNLGRLTVSSATGNLDGDAAYERIDLFGARSFSIWDASGALVWDSGDQLERITAQLIPTLFNSNQDSSPGSFDTRSDNKGPEPEAVTLGVVGGRTLAFVGLERTGGLAVFDITDPLKPVYVDYMAGGTDFAPEGITFIPAAASPFGLPGVVVANELSNTTSWFSVVQNTAQFEINGLTPGTQHDQTQVTGVVDLGGAELQVIGSFVPNPGTLQQIVLITNNGADPVVGTFDQLPEGSAVTLNGQSLFISYAGGDGNDVVLSSQPLLAGTHLADTFVVTGDGTTFTVTRTNTNGTITANFVSPIPALNVLGAGGDDILIVQYSDVSPDPIPSGGIVYDGGTQANDPLVTPNQPPFNPPQTFGDVLVVEDTRLVRTLSTTYTPSATTFGSGVVTVAGATGGTITFADLEPVDISGMAVATLATPAASTNDALTITNGKDSATGTIDALVVTGTTGLTATLIESGHFFNNDLLVIDTTANDGDDSVIVTSADNLHANARLQIETGTGTDFVRVDGNVRFTGDALAATVDIEIDSQSIILNGGTLTVTDVTGSVDLDANLGAITSPGAATTDVVATSLVATANAGIGTLADRLLTNVANLSAVVTTTGNIFITETNGVEISAGGLISGSGNISLSAGGAVTQTGAITTTGGLELLGAGSFTLNNAANNVGTLAANTTDTIDYTDSTGLIVGTVNTVGITSTADVALHSAGLTISQPVATGAGDFRIDSSAAVTQTAAITATGLQLTGAGPFTLNNPSNDVTTIAANVTGTISYTDVNALTVGTVDVLGNSVSGITSSGNDVRLSTLGGNLLLDDDVALGAGDLTLAVIGTVTQIAGDDITAGGLELLVTGNVTLTNAANNVATLAANVTGTLNYTDLDALTIGTVTGSGTSSVNATGDIVLSTGDAGATDNLTLPVTFNITSSGGSVTLNAGDDALLNGDVTAATQVTVNVDAGDGESNGVGEVAPGSGGTVTINGVITVNGGAGTTFLNGGDDYDTFDFDPQTTTSFSVNGNAPHGTADGDRLVITVPALTVQTVSDVGSGGFSFAPTANPALDPVTYVSIEEQDVTGGPLNLLIDLTPVYNGVNNQLTMQRVGADLVINRLGTGPVTGNFYTGTLATINSLEIRGGGQNDSVEVFDTGTGLPDFVGTVPGVTNNPNVVGTPEFLFTGGAGTDVLTFNLGLASTAQVYGIGSGSGTAANDGEISTTNPANTLITYFTSVSEVNRAGFNATAGGLQILGDLSGNTINTTDNGGGETRVQPTGYTPFDFSGDNFSSFEVYGLRGSDTLTLTSFGSGQTNNPTIVLDGSNPTGFGGPTDDGLADTLRVLSTSSNTGLVTLLGGLGSDQFFLAGPGLTVDDIAGPVVVDGEDANLANNNDQLFIIDSGDTTADPNVLIAAAGGMNADYAVTGINASGVTFRNIDSFDYTGTQGGDTIDGRFTPTNVPHDLNTVALRGFDGDDQFLLFTSNQWGGVTPVTELPFTRVASGVGTISLYGNDGEDIFGETPAPVIGNTGAMHVGLAVPATTRLIRPTTAATAGGSTIFIDGGDPVPALNQAGDTVGDVLNLDVTDVPKNTAMIVGAGSSGNVLSANTAPFSWVSIEDLNLVDNGKLTGVQIGDVFGRGTTGNDLMQISANATAALPHQVRVRIGGAIMNYNVPGKAVLYGGNGVDTMSQTTAKIPAVFYGEAGNDSLAGGSNNDWLVGGDGNDQITGGEGQNVIWGDNAPTNPGDPTPQDFQGPNDGNDSISSGNGADVIYAGGGHDVVNSGGGNDYIHAGAGNDSVDAGAGDDRVYGYSGNDTLQGNSGNDLLSGGDGNDWLLGHSGNNVLIGGTGSDTLSGGDGNDLLITGGLGGEENSTWTSAPNTMTYAANTYSDPMDNDAALLALLTAWQLNSNAAAPPPEVLALLPIIAPDGSDDDAWGGNGSDLFSWDAADMADESLTAPGPNDFNNPATGPDVRLI
ncbi:Hemolysin, chromosomal [Anatilimnocola aggregata]|uniref:Hemolysin, chromosomal n=1 Tax=Anatilimnocola aggregata TaxID=2528021 RepID=A0A517YN67_9BACT|nr:choice-of-anchor I family protein [Anatilimnocola aggregata]QDU31658.1 Hemolysin, chromosomal [Anatilimnocola aggregata]